MGNQKVINVYEIKSVEFREGKFSGVALLLSLIEPVNIKSDDEIIIELTSGEIYTHSRIGTKKKFIGLITLINEKIKKN